MPPTTDSRPFIVRRAPRNGVKVRHYISYGLHVSRIDETRATGRSIGGFFREVENTGRKVAGILRIQTKDRFTLDGHGRSGSHSEHVRTNPVEVKKNVRRVRPEELAEIAKVDADIAVVEQELKTLKATRAEIVATAWAKAHVVTVKELEELADAPREPVEPMDADTRRAGADAQRAAAGLLELVGVGP